MPEKQPTKNQHYVPQIYLRGFSSDSTGIYEYNLKQEKPIHRPVSIESICREKNLYEFRDNDGGFIWNNYLEDTIGEYEGQFAEYRKRLLSKAIHKENYKTKSFLTAEERFFWQFYTTLQIMRVPSILNGITETMKEELPEGFTENEIRNIAIAYSLPFFKKPDSNETNAFLFFLSVLRTRILTVGFAKSDHLFTSDHPMYGIKGPEEMMNFKSLWFPITSNCVLIFSAPQTVDPSMKNRLIPLSEKDEQRVNSNIAYMAKEIILSKHPFSKDDIALIKQARKEQEQDKARLSIH